MKKLLLALALFFIPALAQAQCNGVFPNNTVCGNVTGANNTPRPTTPSAFLGAAGGTNGQIQYNNNGALGGLSILNNSYLTPGAANTVKGTVNGTSEADLALPSCSIGGSFLQWLTGTGFQCSSTATSASMVLQSRAQAQTLDLTAFSAVKTLGYTTPGDEGGATFVKTTSPAFIDTYITGYTITGGSGYTNGTYYNVPFGGTGGPTVSGLGCQGGVVVSGGAVTALLIDMPCSGFTVGNILTAANSTIGGTGSGFTFTVTTISSPGASFTDSAGNKWQYVTDEGHWPNIKQFGAKMDYNGVDSGSTNDIGAFRSAFAWAWWPYTGGGALINGTTVIVPKGATFICGAPLVIPAGVTLKGSGVYGGTTIKDCSTESQAVNVIQLCTIYATRGQFGCQIRDMVIKADGFANSNIAVIYSNSGQQFPLVDTVFITPGYRTCITYDTGVGGASNAEFINGDCEGSVSSSNPGIVILPSVGSTMILIQNWVIECGGCTVHIGIAVAGGFLVAENIQFEAIYEGIIVNTVNPATIKNVFDQSTAVCNFVIQATSTNPAGSTVMENINPGTCPNTFANSRAGGISIAGYIGHSISP